MRVLHLFRHAKSDWGDAGLSDYDRPLAPRGWAAAPLMGRRMRAAGVAPQAAFCSTAARAQQTALLAFEEMGWPPQTQYRRDLYLAECEALLAFIRGLDDAVRTAMVIGHNPGLGELAAALPGEGDAEQRRRIAEKFPTAALASIAFGAASWRAVGFGAGRLMRFDTPRNAAES